MTQPVPDPGSLERLRDIVVPPPVPWWPPAPGWYFVGTGLIVLAAVWVWRVARWWGENRYRREALAELDRLETRAGERATRPGALEALAGLTKRAAISAFGRERVASLTGDAWFRFLDETGGGGVFRQEPGRLLERLAYAPAVADQLSEDERRQLFEAVRGWLRRHDFRQRPGPGGGA